MRAVRASCRTRARARARHRRPAIEFEHEHEHEHERFWVAGASPRYERMLRMEANFKSDIGYVHVYTGDGKGKTTAALGLALRAAGAGWNVFIGQFVKGMTYSELAILERLSDRITIRQFGRDCFIRRKPGPADLDCAERGLAECKEIMLAGNHRLVVLDEANVAVALGLFPVDALLDLIALRSDPTELVITGRWAHARVIQRADLVTEMQEVKHYYRQGVLARVGVEA
jgi:cob(I)alamin adenosyltransferase